MLIKAERRECFRQMFNSRPAFELGDDQYKDTYNQIYINGFLEA